MNTWNRTAIANLDAARKVEAQLLESETGLIASTELIEQNARAVNEIYLNTVGHSGEDVEFDATQTAMLLSIAEQCPLLGGNPVYQARSLYSLIDDAAEFDDALICIADGIVVKNLEEPVPSVNVFPNPTRTGQLFFEVTGHGDEEQQGRMVLHDVEGRPVLVQTTMGPRGVINVGALAQGIYQWTLSIEDKPVDRGKVTIF